MLFFLLISVESKADNLPGTDKQLWANITATGPLKISSSRFRFWLETQQRFGDDMSQLSQSLFRVGIGHTIGPELSLWLGYGWIHNNFPFTLQPFNDQRIWQQLLWNSKLGSLHVSSRTRLEERFFPDNRINMRLRELLKFQLPWKVGSKLSWIASDEVFFHLYDHNQNGFDQNRLFVGFGYSITKRVTTEIGYLNQVIDRVNEINYSGNYLALNLLLNYD